MTIEVTLYDISKGEKDCAYACPIAIACKRAGLCDAEVGNCSITWEAPDGAMACAEIPECAQQFVEDFDDGEPVFPITFEIWE